ncbi:MAG: hypothetical protein GQ468_04195 [Candidatus Scalindua sp.]|nr:hypothetical protein [Candidatus Scalindua sp.]
MEMRIVFALNNAGEFEKKHFGDADRYHIYLFDNGRLNLLYEEVNPYKSMDKTSAHGTKTKADRIIKFLKKKDVKVLVSMRFGKNIKLIINHFIPVEVKEETPEKVKTILLKQMRWLEDEMNNHPEEHKIFVMDSGILKTDIRNRHF